MFSYSLLTLCCLLKDHLSSTYFSKGHLSFTSLLQKLAHSATGVSNTRPAGRMWPARCVCAARGITKTTQIIDKTTVFSSVRAISASNCGPRRHFSSKCGPRAFFVKMWPAYETEFETPVLQHVWAMSDPLSTLILISIGRIYNLRMNLMTARLVQIGFYYGLRVKKSCLPLCNCPRCLK
jgi:hypothetical protein